MNVKNNKRRQYTIKKIEKVFMNLILTKEINEISVSDICKGAEINRSTFYANFLDVYDLADKLREKLEQDFGTNFKDEDNREQGGALKMFRHIKENQLFYKTYFKLGYEEQNRILTYDTGRAERDFGNKNIDYHIEFFRNGLNAIIKMWLAGGCKESPEEMAEILKAEYRGR